MDCPYNKQEIGNTTWHLLHSIVAHFPENPSTDSQDDYKEFFLTFPYVYPCRPCAKDFQVLVKENPPIVDSRVSASLWLCKLHNIVNEKLSKPLFNCSIKELDLRWKKGPQECYKTEEREENIIY
jgi:mitochondrial FAD-linked sulfhydryl oxidase